MNDAERSSGLADRLDRVEAQLSEVTKNQWLILRLINELCGMIGTRTGKDIDEKIAGAISSLKATETPLPNPDEIKGIREKCGLTRKEAAERVRITPTAWFYLESGKNVPSKQTAFLIRLLELGVI